MGYRLYATPTPLCPITHVVSFYHWYDLSRLFKVNSSGTIFLLVNLVSRLGSAAYCIAMCAHCWFYTIDCHHSVPPDITWWSQWIYARSATLLNAEICKLGTQCFCSWQYGPVLRYDSVCLTCSKKLTGSQLSLPHGTNKKLKCKTKNKMMSVIGPVQSCYREAVFI